MASGTCAQFIASFEHWLRSDALVQTLKEDPSLRELKIFGASELERLKWTELSATPGTREFSVAAAEGDLGVHFTTGFAHRITMVRDGTGIEGAVHFLDGAVGTDGGAGPGVVGAVMDEVLGNVSFAFNLGGFTASLTLEAQQDPVTGAKLVVPIGKTLCYEGSVKSSATNARGVCKSFVVGALLSADHSTVYAKASGVFVRPTYMPSPEQLEELSQGEAYSDLLLEKAAQDMAEQASAQRLRAAALDTLRAVSGSPMLVTHLSDFAARRRRWLEEDVLAGSIACPRDLGAPELLGKVFSALSAAGGSSLRGAIKFAFCSQGPPSTAHGGSRFAVLERASLVLAQDLHPEADVRLMCCEVQLKARLPLDATVRLELAAERLSSGPRREELRVRGRLVSGDGQTVYDTLTATVTVSRDEILPLPARHGSTIVPASLSSKL